METQKQDKKLKLISGWAKAENETDLWDPNSDVLCIVDNGLLEDLTPYQNNKKVAVLWEPHVINGKTYNYVKNHINDFEFIFTHENEMLKYPNARPLVNWCVWCQSDVPKTKGISMVTSDKRYCDLHIKRLQIAESIRYKNNVCVYGPINETTNWVNPIEIHRDYKFEVVIENYIDDYWFTEKILNCFACKTIPIYYGANKLKDYFNMDGVIQVNSPEEIISVIDNLNIDEEYNKRLEAIEDNYVRVNKYHRLGDWLLDTYHEEFQSLFNE